MWLCSLDLLHQISLHAEAPLTSSRKDNAQYKCHRFQPVIALLYKKSPPSSCGAKIKYRIVVALKRAGFRITQRNTERQHKSRICRVTRNLRSTQGHPRIRYLLDKKTDRFGSTKWARSSLTLALDFVVTSNFDGNEHFQQVLAQVNTGMQHATKRSKK